MFSWISHLSPADAAFICGLTPVFLGASAYMLIREAVAKYLGEA